jgi:hypothetical protein
MYGIVYLSYLGAACAAVGINLWARKRRLRPRAVAAVNAALALAVFPSLMAVSEPAEWLSDFRKAYHASGRLVLSDPAAMYGRDQLAFVNLPLVALFFQPWGLLAIRPARYLFMLLGLAVCGLAWVVLARQARADGWRRTALAGLFLFHGPLYYSLREGNLTHFALLAVVAALVCLERRRDLALGAVLAVAGILKPPLLLLGAYFGCRRWRAAAGGAGVLLLAGACSLAVCGAEAHRVWFDRCLGPYSSRPMTDYNVQSLTGVLARLLTDAPLGNDWRPVAVDGRFHLLHLLLLSGLVGGPLLVCLRARGPDPAGARRLEFCVVLCLAVLASPVSWTHYYLLLLVPAALALGGRLPALAPGRGAWVLALGVLLTCPPVIDLSSADGGPGRWLASHYWAGGVLVLGALTAARWRTGSPAPRLRLVFAASARATRLVGGWKAA